MREPSHPSPPTATPLRACLDGQPLDHLLLSDRGLHYGDGLFETLLIRAGRPCLWDAHCERLGRGAARLGLVLPDLDLLKHEIEALVQGQERGVLKLILTRGSTGRGYAPPLDATLRRLLLLYPEPEHGRHRETGVIIRDCQTPASLNPALAGLKHLNRLDSVLARAEWHDPAIAEGLMYDPDGALIGGTMSNVFLWDDERLLTPALERAGIAGTVRAQVLRLAVEFGLSCEEQRIARSDLAHISGLFLTNAVIGVWPVRQYAGRVFELGTLPWPLLKAVRDLAHHPD